MTAKAVTTALCLIAVIAGCSGIESSITSVRHRKQASEAWKRSMRTYETKGVPRPFIKDFGAGWKQGFYNVAQGGSGRLPVVAPPKYWGFKNENQGGFTAMSSWFDGFAAGATDAQAAGAGNWARLPTSAPYQVDLGPDTPSSPTGAEQVLGLEPGETLIESTPAVEELPAGAVPTGTPENRN